MEEGRSPCGLGRWEQKTVGRVDVGRSLLPDSGQCHWVLIGVYLSWLSSACIGDRRVQDFSSQIKADEGYDER
jgi:hypothetical protein